jgi:cytochrome c
MMILRIASATALLLSPGVALAQAGDPVAGAKQFAQCRTCHATVATAPDGLGPNLVGVYGKKAATHRKKFAYSPALKASRITWDDASLDRWITDPAAMVKGTKMVFIGIARKPARQNIIAYLKTLK